MILRVALGLGLFLGSMAFGWWLGRRGWLTERTVSRVVRWLVIGTSPLILCLSFWRMDLRRADFWLLPLFGVAVSVSTLLPAWVYVKRARLYFLLLLKEPVDLVPPGRVLIAGLAELPVFGSPQEHRLDPQCTKLLDVL